MTQGRARAREDKSGACFALGGGVLDLLSYLALWPHGAIRRVTWLRTLPAPGLAWPWLPE